LWHLFVVIALLAIPLGWIVDLRQRVVRQREAIHAAKMLGASVNEYELAPTWWSPIHEKLAGSVYPTGVGLSFQNLGQHKSWGPYGKNGAAVEILDWKAENIRQLGPALRQLEGLEQLSFWNSPLPPGMVAEILPQSDRLMYVNLQSSPVNRADLAALRRLPNLERLILTESDVLDEDLQHVAALGKLNFLHLEDTRITDAGVAHLAGMRGFDEVNLGLTRVTTDSIPILVGWQVTTKLLVPAEWPEEAEAELKRQMPSTCEVRRSSLEFRFRPSAKALQSM
jgi:hypothetical protein